MGLFSCKSCQAYDKQVSLLRIQLSDQQEAYIKLQQTFERERQMLLDKLLAVAAPSAVRELARASYNAHPRERRPLSSSYTSRFASPGPPAPEIGVPKQGRLRPKPPVEADRSAETTPEEAAAQLAEGAE